MNHQQIPVRLRPPAKKQVRPKPPVKKAARGAACCAGAAAP